MATDLTNLEGTLTLKVLMTAEKATDLTTVKDILSRVPALEYAFGTGADQGNQMWHDRRTLAGNASEDLDLAGGLTNAFGSTVTFAAIKTIIIINHSDEQTTATDATITVGGASANQFQGPFGNVNDTISIKAGGFFCICDGSAAGWTVTAATGDLLKIANADATDTAEYDIIIIGESA